MLKVLFISPTSVTFERINNDVFYSTPINLFCNDKLIIENEKRNVFSVFDLTPKTKYTFKCENQIIELETMNVSTIFDIKDFGAYGDGIHDDTKAINQAIMMLPDNGLLVFNKGTYRVTSIFLKSNINIEIKKDAFILASENVDDYPVFKGEIDTFDQQSKIELGQWEGLPFPMKASIISAYWVKNVQLYGEGVIDGNAQNSTFWDDVRKKEWGRPRLVFLDGCENITLQGLNLRNTPCWTLHPFFSKNVNFYDLFIKNPKDSPNTDGMDPESCDGVNIIGVRFSVGDDCIAIKSGKMYMGLKFKTPCQNINIRNCLMNEGHGAIVLGSEMSGGIKKLNVERCLFINTDRGLRIKTRRGRGKLAIIDDVLFKDIIMDGVLTPLVINMFYFCDPDGKTEFVWSKKKLPVDDSTPYLGKFHFLNIHATKAEYAAGYFYGLPERPINEIVIENSDFSFKENARSGMPAMMSYIEPQCKLGLFFNGVNLVKLKNVKISGYVGDKIVKENVEEIVEE